MKLAEIELFMLSVLFARWDSKWNNRLKVVWGILCSRHDLQDWSTWSHISSNTLGEQNKQNPSLLVHGWFVTACCFLVWMASAGPTLPALTRRRALGATALCGLAWPKWGKCGLSMQPGRFCLVLSCTVLCFTCPSQSELCYSLSCWLHVICHQHLWLRGAGMMWESFHRGGRLWGKCYGILTII